MKFSIQTIIWAIVVLAIIVAGGFALIPKPVDVEFATVNRGRLRVSVQEDGKTRIREKYIVSAPVAGRLSRIELRPGDDISPESSLLTVIMPSEPEMLDARSRAQANARVQAAEAAVQRAEANSEQANINLNLNQARFDRAKRLFPEKAISKDEYDIVRAESLASLQATKTAKFDTEIAKFELDMARAAVLQFSDSRADSNFQPFEIYAPISGKVLRVFQESATVVSVGTPLLETGDPRILEIEIDVLSTDAVRIKPGAELTIEHWGGQLPLKGIVRVIEPAAFTKISSLGVEEQRVNIIADFNEPADRIATLGDGYRVEARITIDEVDDVLLVPNSALFRHQRKWHVLSIVGNKAVIQEVEIGVQNDSMTRVKAGLNEGDRVIIYPSDQVSSGTKVRLVNGQ